LSSNTEKGSWILVACKFAQRHRTVPEQRFGRVSSHRQMLVNGSACQPGSAKTATRRRLHDCRNREQISTASGLPPCGVAGKRSGVLGRHKDDTSVRSRNSRILQHDARLPSPPSDRLVDERGESLRSAERGPLTVRRRSTEARAHDETRRLQSFTTPRGRRDFS
jgi:hypothetical protein